MRNNSDLEEHPAIQTTYENQKEMGGVSYCSFFSFFFLPPSFNSNNSNNGKKTYSKVFENFLSQGFIVNTHINALIELCKFDKALLGSVSSNISLCKEELRS
jgi:hypothetical protein